VSEERFEQLVADALDALPESLGRQMRNVVVQVADDSPPGGPVLLGLYHGVPLTERGASYAGVLPDMITIYRLPILSVCADEAAVADQVRVTVIHEVAHHFGIGDDELDELGWS